MVIKFTKINTNISKKIFDRLKTFFDRLKFVIKFYY